MAYRDLVLSHSPIAYWRFGESTGTNAADEVGLDAGVYTGGFTLGTPGLLPGERASTSVLLNGTTGYINVAAASLTAPGDTFTWMAWVKRTATGGVAQRLYDRNASADFQVFINSGTLNHWQLEAQADGVESESSTTLDTNPHFLVATKAGATVHLYQDGVDVTGAVTNTTIVGASGSLIIGQSRAQTNVDPYNGALQEYALFNTALTAADVVELYRAGITPAAIPQIVGWLSPMRRYHSPPPVVVAAGPVNNTVTLTAGLSFTGTQRNAIGTHLPAAALSFTGSLPRAITKKLTAASLGFVGSLPRAIGTRLVAASVGFTGSLRRSIGTRLTSALSFTGSLPRAMGTHLAAGLSFTGALRRSIAKALTGAVLSFTGNLLAGRQFHTTLTAGLSFVGTLPRQTGKSLAAALSFVGGLSQRLNLHVTLTAALSFAGSLPRRTTKTLTGAVLSFTGTLTERLGLHVTFTAALSFVGSLPRRTGKALSGGLSFSGSLGKGIRKGLTASVAFVGSIATSIVAIVQGVIGSIPTGFSPSEPPSGPTPLKPPSGVSADELNQPGGIVGPPGTPGGGVKN
jgi:hypothetical protein